MRAQTIAGMVKHKRKSILLGGPQVSSLTSTLTSSAASFTAGGPGVTLTFTARLADGTPVEGFPPVPESGVTP